MSPNAAQPTWAGLGHPQGYRETKNIFERILFVLVQFCGGHCHHMFLHWTAGQAMEAFFLS